MAADSRSTHTDALATLGTILKPGEKRDAIHLGVLPIQAGEKLKAGDPIGIGEDGRAYMSWFGCAQSYKSTPKYVGIVDPFLEETVYKGKWFWLIVKPREITSLRHVWEHPDFPASNETGGNELMVANQEQELKELQARVLISDPAAIAKTHLMSIADTIGVEYDELIEKATEYHLHGDYWVEGGRFEGMGIGDQTLFWSSYEEVTGNKIKLGKVGNFLSCSC